MCPQSYMRPYVHCSTVPVATTWKQWKCPVKGQADFEADDFEWPVSNVVNIQMALGGKKVPHPWVKEQA